jgi:hypothetical protein
MHVLAYKYIPKKSPQLEVCLISLQTAQRRYPLVKVLSKNILLLEGGFAKYFVFQVLSKIMLN